MFDTDVEQTSLITLDIATERIGSIRQDVDSQNRPIAPGEERNPLPPWDPNFPGAFFISNQTNSIVDLWMTSRIDLR